MPYRVKDTSTGHEYTVAAVLDGQTVLEDKEAVDVNGRWLPPKYNTELLTPKQSKATKATPEAKEATA